MGPGNEDRRPPQTPADWPAQQAGLTGLDGTGSGTVMSDEFFAKALPASGAPMEGVRTEPDRDYPDDTSLLFERGGTGFVIRLTPADRQGVLAALANPDAQAAAGAQLPGRSGYQDEHVKHLEHLKHLEANPYG
jgi:hypothetical protein